MNFSTKQIIFRALMEFSLLQLFNLDIFPAAYGAIFPRTFSAMNLQGYMIFPAKHFRKLVFPVPWAWTGFSVELHDFFHCSGEA